MRFKVAILNEKNLEPVPEAWQKLPQIEGSKPLNSSREYTLMRIIGTPLCSWYDTKRPDWGPFGEVFIVEEIQTENSDALQEFNNTVDGIEARTMSVDGPVTPTLQEATEEELSRLWHLLQQLKSSLQELNKLQAFKKYVHMRLDAAQIPADPEPEKNAKHGCRIEGRLNYVLNFKYTRGLVESPEHLLQILRSLGNLLAVMHGDGGHYEAEHGTVKAITDAEALLHSKWVRSEDEPSDNYGIPSPAEELNEVHRRMNEWGVPPGSVKTRLDYVRDQLVKLDEFKAGVK